MDLIPWCDQWDRDKSGERWCSVLIRIGIEGVVGGLWSEWASVFHACAADFMGGGNVSGICRLRGVFINHHIIFGRSSDEHSILLHSLCGPGRNQSVSWSSAEAKW